MYSDSNKRRFVGELESVHQDDYIQKKRPSVREGTEKVPLEKRLKKGVENCSFLLPFSYFKAAFNGDQDAHYPT
ncbi:hypothetical protein, partial [Sphingobacteruim zhuxiongii]|uniref:hypothetical protein n=1 Tax=Sphingobacterium zhuxiongii TaxID=2662364 RepID=UPI001F252C62